MKLFIFRPHQTWSYCGGAIIILAEKFEDCQEIFTKYVQERFPKEEFNLSIRTLEEVELPVNKYEERHTWVLEETFEVNASEPRVVLDDWNDG